MQDKTDLETFTLKSMQAGRLRAVCDEACGPWPPLQGHLPPIRRFRGSTRGQIDGTT